ncbi:GSCOCG00010988001-RA-CDS [Cotesia congregata]|nr:GSCOCG00010988001-RA-CDS [Cotesia congregata]
MHCIGLGVCRQFGDLWFNPVNHEKKFYYGKYTDLIDKVLTSYKPSLEVSRTPRAITDRVHWKAHEWIFWLLFYSFPTLKSIFSKELLEHWSLLVEAVTILTKTSIMKSEIYYAKQLLSEFVEGVEMLYGEEYVSFNVHLTVHLADSVLNWGPLSTHSAFLYEDYNQLLQEYIKSSNGVALQICDNFRLKSAVDNLEYVCFEHLTILQQKYLD